MATSVIDYIFRDLAISYLKRTDLAQVKPEDLLATGTKKTTEQPRPEPSVTAPGEMTAPREMTAPGEIKAPGEQSEIIKIVQARIKGYEGDPCPVCGSFTLVRNGTCMKCNTCGGTTGCS
jgi:ribonucleoside-diphosphate reductase alpha chain